MSKVQSQSSSEYVCLLVFCASRYICITVLPQVVVFSIPGVSKGFSLATLSTAELLTQHRVVPSLVSKYPENYQVFCLYCILSLTSILLDCTVGYVIFLGIPCITLLLAHLTGVSPVFFHLLL